MLLQNLPDLNTLKENDKQIEKIRVCTFLSDCPEINLNLENKVSIKYIGTDHKESVMNTILDFCKSNKVPLDFISQMRNDIKADFVRSKILVVEFEEHGKDFQSVDLNELVIGRIIENDLNLVKSTIGLIYRTFPEFYGALVFAHYAGGKVKFIPMIMDVGYNYVKVEADKVSLFNHCIETMRKKPFFIYIINLQISALNETNREISIFKFWIVLESLAEYVIEEIGTEDQKKVYKKEKVLCILRSIPYKDNLCVMDKINTRRIDYIYQIRNDMVHNGFICDDTIRKYADLSENSLQHQVDFLGYITALVITFLMGIKNEYPDNFLDKFK